MYKLKLVAFCLSLAVLLTGCWSSKQIEDLGLYAGLALDSGQPAPTEKTFEAKGATYAKQNKLMATVQVIPSKSIGSKDNKQHETKLPYINVSGSGDSILEIFRQFSIRLDRPIIGHHLKVIVISADLLKKQTIQQVSDFILRDNDIRPSTLVYISEGSARETLISGNPAEVPSFHIIGMLRNLSRTSKVLPPFTLSRLDGKMHAKRSFVLQNLVTGGGETELSGAGIIKGATGHWVGTLSQEDTQCLAWLGNDGQAGVIKVNDWDNQPFTYEIKTIKSKMVPRVDGDKISFSLSLSTEGRLIEVWNKESGLSPKLYAEKAVRLIEDKLAKMMETLIRKLQVQYKTDVAGFGRRLAIENPAVWKTVKDDWDEVFSGVEVTFSCEVNVTDFGSFTEEGA